MCDSEECLRSMNKPNPAARWNAWRSVEELDEYPPLNNRAAENLDWARRGDGALMLQDGWGWFAMVTGEDGIIRAQSCDSDDGVEPPLFDVYCEPVWLAWAADHEFERDNG